PRAAPPPPPTPICPWDGTLSRIRATLSSGARAGAVEGLRLAVDDPHGRGFAQGVRGSVPELAEPVVAPAPHGVIVLDRAGRAPDREGDDVALEPRHRHG